MFKKERQAYIIHQLNLHNKVLSADLCEDMKVSEDTIRRDLQELADSGKLIKVYGGALSIGFDNTSDFNHEGIYALDKKRQIVSKAITLLREGMFVFTTGGTTILELIRNLPLNVNITIVTCSIPVLHACLAHPSIEAISIGEKVSKTSKLAVGSEAIKKINDFHADICFIGTNAIDINHGLTDNDWEVVQIKKAMINSSSKSVCMVISEKLQSRQPISVAEINQIDYLITELNPDHQLLQPFQEEGITIL